MPYGPYAPPIDWKDYNEETMVGDPSTPLSQANIEIMEAALAAYAKESAKRGEYLFFPEDYGAQGNGIADDTAELQDCIDDARENAGKVIMPAGAKYLCNAAPRTDRGGNSILALTEADPTYSYKPVEVIGAGPLSSIAGYEVVAGYNPAQIITTRTGDTYSATNGPPSVLGGWTEEQGFPSDYGAPLGRTNAIGVTGLRNFWVVTPENPDIAAIDMLSFGGCDAVDLQAVAGDGGTAAAVPTSEHAFGIRWPARWCASRNFNLRCGAHQFYAGHVFRYPDHHVNINGWTYKCNIAYAFESAGDANQGFYGMHWAYAMSGASPYGIAGWDPVTGVETVEQKNFFHRSTLQLENAAAPFALVSAIFDDDNELEGDLQLHYFGGLAVDDNVALNGAQNLRLELSRASEVGGATTVASASTIEAPAYLKVVRITGSTTIANIEASYPGRRIMIIWHTSATFDVDNAGNINLNTDITTATAGDSLCLECDGVNWQPCGGSVL